MQNRDKIIRDVALELGIPQTEVRKVVTSQALLIRGMIKSKSKRAIWLYKVGQFISPYIKSEINLQKTARRIKKYAENKQTPEEEPTEF